MTPWGQILFWWVVFALAHTLLSSTRVRPRLLSRLGSNGFLATYSLLALATFVPLIVTYFSHRHSGMVLWDLHAIAWVNWSAWVISWAGWTLALAALLQPSPVSIGAGLGQARARGITRISRHGLFTGLTAWALAHLALNGTTSDAAFFGGFAVYTILGILHQDARKRATVPELARFYRETSVVPFAAIVAGRTRLELSEFSWIGLTLACGVAYGLYALHPWLFQG